MRRLYNQQQGCSGSAFLGALIFVVVLSCCSDPIAADTLQQSVTQEDQTAEELLGAGNAAYDGGDRQKAEEKWLEVRNLAQTTDAWPKAVFNLGMLKTQDGKYREAIASFNEVLQSHPLDKEPGGNLMEAYRNYSHRSVLQISLCYEKMGQNSKALHYAWLAKTRYPYLSWCGTCLQSANFALDKRIAYLSWKVFAIPVLVITGLACIFFARKLAT